MPKMGDLAAQDSYENQYAPYGVGSPAESAGAPSGMGSILKGGYEYLGDLAKRAFGASEQMRTEGTYNPAPIMEAAMLPMTGAVAGTGPGGFAVGAGPIKAYHSSPHDFEKFDLSKIGSGEGAQVYGHGLYFAENPKVSGQGGQYWDQFKSRFTGPESTAATELKLSKFDRELAQRNLSEEINRLIDRGERPGVIANRTKALQLLESGKPVGPRTYEVNINADPAQLLNWDKPFTAQSPQVQEALLRSGVRPESPGPMGTKTMSDLPVGPMAQRGLKDPASLLNRNFDGAGILGIKYLDEGSRGVSPYNIIPTGSGNYIVRGNRYSNIADAQQAKAAADAVYETERTRNYVIRDPSILDIMKKYGIVGAAPAAMGALAAQDQYNAK